MIGEVAPGNLGGVITDIRNHSTLVLYAVFAIVTAFNIWAARRYRQRPEIILSDADEKLIRNEQWKLSASWANTIATAFLVGGAIPTGIAFIKAISGRCRRAVARGIFGPDFDFARGALTSGWSLSSERITSMSVLLEIVLPIALTIVSVAWTAILRVTPKVSLKSQIKDEAEHRVERATAD